MIKGYLLGSGANLSGANLSAANLAFLNLSGANFNGANLTGAVLIGIQWAFTTCPDGVRGASTPCSPVAWLGSSTVSASAKGPDDTLLVDVGPTLSGGGEWRVTVQTLSVSGGWVAVSTHTTKGVDDTLRLILPQGMYRAVVPPQRSYRASTSSAVALAKQDRSGRCPPAIASGAPHVTAMRPGSRHRDDWRAETRADRRFLTPADKRAIRLAR